MNPLLKKTAHIWTSYLESLDKKYSLYYINRKYKEISFKSIEEYKNVQEKLMDEINLLEDEIKESIKRVVFETYPEIEVLLYNSITFSKENEFIGKILTKGIKTQSETLDVKACFERFAGTKIDVERIEDLSDDQQEELKKFLK